MQSVHFGQTYPLALLTVQDQRGGFPRRNTDKAKDFPFPCHVVSAPLYVTRLPR